MNSSDVMGLLENITFSSNDYNQLTRFQPIDEEFEDFEMFPLIVLSTGEEEISPQANLRSIYRFHPSIHLYCEDMDVEDMDAWKDDIVNAIMDDAELLAAVIRRNVIKITPRLSEQRKLQILRFDLEIIFDNSHTPA